MHAFWTYAFAVVGPGADTLSRYLSTTSRPQSSLTTGIVAGTSIWNVTAEFAEPVHTNNSFLAALMASLMAQCTEHARTSGGSPAPATEKMVQSTAHHARVSVSGSSQCSAFRKLRKFARIWNEDETLCRERERERERERGAHLLKTGRASDQERC